MESITQGLIYGIIAGLLVLLIGLIMPRRKCPECGKSLPKFRKPSTTKQALWGGGTCPNCGCEVDKKGKKVKE